MNTDLSYEAVPSKFESGAWRVEAIENGGDGRAYIAIFSGPDAQLRAEEYAEWKNAGPVHSHLVAADA